MNASLIITITVIAVLLFTLLLVALTRYRRCPSDKVLVVYGKVGTNKDGTNRSAKRSRRRRFYLACNSVL